MEKEREESAEVREREAALKRQGTRPDWDLARVIRGACPKLRDSSSYRGSSVRAWNGSDSMAVTPVGTRWHNPPPHGEADAGKVAIQVLRRCARQGPGRRELVPVRGMPMSQAHARVLT
jgi:hypothetical protein